MSLTCDLAESVWLEEGTFEDQDLGSVDASCSNGVITLSADNTSSDVTSLSCDDGTEFKAKALSGEIEIDMSDVIINISTKSLSGNGTISAKLEAEIGEHEDAQQLECIIAITKDMSKNEDIEGITSFKCAFGDSTDYKTRTPSEDCNGIDKPSQIAKWLNYFGYLMPMD